MSPQRSICVLTLAALAAPFAADASAQGGVAPPRAAEHWGWKSRDFPLGRAACRFQIRIDAKMLPSGLSKGKLIRSIGLRRSTGRSTFKAATLQSEVWIGDTAATNQSFSTSFAANRSATSVGRTVFPRAKLSLPAAGFGSPRDFVTIQFNRPYVFAGPGLLVEISNAAASQQLTGWQVDYVGTLAAGTRRYFGKKCFNAGPTSVSSAQNFVPGAKLDFWTGPGNGNVPAIHALGFSCTKFGPLSLPVNLSAAGAKDCSLYVSLDLMMATVRNATGTARNSITLPNVAGLRNAQFYTQWINVEPNANALGLTFTEATMIIIGPVSGINSTRLANTSSHSAASGSKFNNEMPVMRVVF